METLLIAAIIVTALAVLVQAGSLIAMYLMTRRAVDNVNGLVAESRKLMGPLQRVTANLESASHDLIAIGKDARVEMQHVQEVLSQAETAVRQEAEDLRLRFNETVDQVQGHVTAPFREWSAIANGITAGVRRFFRRQPASLEEQIRRDIHDNPAA